MKLIDISKNVFKSYVYPGDPTPQMKSEFRIANGDKCNLTSIVMCCHNGTHVDAPYHFIEDGKKIGDITLSKFIGECRVIIAEDILTEEYAKKILSFDSKKVLLKGKTEITIEAAECLATGGIDLLGVESCTVGNEVTGEKIHKILLGKEIVILESLELGEVEEGTYFIFAQPVNLGEVDGAPCRAVLVKEV